MGLNLHLSRSLVALAVTALLIAPRDAQAQTEGNASAPKEPPTPEKIAEWKKEAEARPLFAADTPIELRLVGNYRVISRDRDTLSTKEYWGEVQMKDASGADAKYPVQLRTRGHYRLANRNCSFVPLRLDFKTGQMKGTVFEGQDKLKLVTHCNPNALFDEYIIREYLAYKVHNLVTPRSYRARLAKVTYVDSATGNVMDTRNGIFLEHEDDVAKRMEGEIVEIRRALFDDVDFDQLMEMTTFASFIGHLDYSIAALHNVRLVRQQSGTLLPVLYDLDFTGIVNTRYSTPDPRLGVRTVRDRLFRGPCQEPQVMGKYLAPYWQAKDAILKLYDETPGLDNRYRTDTKNWLNNWFKMETSPRDVLFMFKENCKVAPGM